MNEINAITLMKKLKKYAALQVTNSSVVQDTLIHYYK